MSTNPYSPPTAVVADPEATDLDYAGFWLRVVASLIDSVLVAFVTVPILLAVYGTGYFNDETKGVIAGTADFFISWVLPAVAVVIFWISKQATPGKMVFSMKVLDARTGRAMSVGQSIGRYLAYFVSLLPLSLGIFWVAFDKRKQGWHDKLAGTVVVRQRRGAQSGGTPVRFEARD